MSLAIFGILLFVTYGMSIFAIAFVIRMAMSRHIRMKLNTGSTVKVPICQKADVSEFLQELNYSAEEIAKNEAEKVSAEKWKSKERRIYHILRLVAAVTMVAGLALCSSSLKGGTSKPSSENIQQYLVNDGTALPIQIDEMSKSVDFYTDYTTFTFDVVNLSGVDVKEAQFGIVAWDSNGLPVELEGIYDFESMYFYTAPASNIAAEENMTASIEFAGSDFKYIQILVLEYTDFEGNIWTNPAADYYKENYAGKKMDEKMMCFEWE